MVLLVDLLDASGSFLSKLRSLTGRNPIILVGTKASLWPEAAMIAKPSPGCHEATFYLGQEDFIVSCLALCCKIDHQSLNTFATVILCCRD